MSAQTAAVREASLKTDASLNWIRTGPPDSPTILFLHAVGYDLTYWDRQIEALSDSFTVVAVDLPGHGRSPGLAQDWSFANAAAIISRLIESLDRGPVHLVGISFGGMIAQTLVLARPDLVRSLTLIATAPAFSEPTRAAMRDRARLTRESGMAAVLPSSLDRWFTQETRQRMPHLIDRVSKTVLADNPAVHAAIWEIVSHFDVQERLHEIHCPTLVLVGEADPSTHQLQPPRSRSTSLARSWSSCPLPRISSRWSVRTPSMPSSNTSSLHSEAALLNFDGTKS